MDTAVTAGRMMRGKNNNIFTLAIAAVCVAHSDADAADVACAVAREYKEATITCNAGETINIVEFAAWGVLAEGSDCTTGEIYTSLKKIYIYIFLHFRGGTYIYIRFRRSPLRQLYRPP